MPRASFQGLPHQNFDFTKSARIITNSRNNFLYLVSLNPPYRDESNGAKFIIIGRVDNKIFIIIAFDFLGGLVHVIPTSRPKI